MHTVVQLILLCQPRHTVKPTVRLAFLFTWAISNVNHFDFFLLRLRTTFLRCAPLTFDACRMDIVLWKLKENYINQSPISFHFEFTHAQSNSHSNLLRPSGFLWVINLWCNRKVINRIRIFIILLITTNTKAQIPKKKKKMIKKSHPPRKIRFQD